MRGRVCWLLAGLCWAAAPAQAAREVDRFVGRDVFEVRLTVDGRPLEDRTARELVETRVGAPLSMREVRETLAHLFSLGLYRAVEVGAGDRSGGVALHYRLQSLDVVARVEFAGARGVPEEALRRLVARRHGATFLAGEAAAVAETVRGAYRERGFFGARVRTGVTGPASRRVLRMTVEAGPRAFVRRWRITGGSPAFHAAVRTRLGLRDGEAPYDGPALERRLGDYEAALRRQGHYEARLSHHVERSGETAVDVRLAVRRGPRIAVTFEGDEVPGAAPADLVPVAREASVDEDLLEDADQRIEAHLRELGYRDARVTHTREGGAERLSIVFRVTRGPLHRVGEVVVRGNEAVSEAEVRSLAGVAAGDPFVLREIDAALAAVEERYSRLGFVTARAARTVRGAEADGAGGPVTQHVEISIDEGVRTIIGDVTFDGASARSPAVLRQAVGARRGAAYHGPQVERDREALLALYLNDGYEQARVAVDTRFSDDLSAVDLVFRIAEGRQVLVDHVLIVGNRQIGTATIRREVALTPGAPLGLDDVAETRRRLNALGVFRRIDVREFSHGRSDRRDVIIEVEEAAATRLAYGGGFELSQRLRRDAAAAGGPAIERLEFAPRGSFEIGRRNLWGGNRSLDLFTRVSVRPKNDPPPPAPVETGGALGFNEYRILATYREPRAVGRGWDVLVSGYAEQAIRPGFDLFSRGVSAQLRRSSGAAAGASVGYRLGNNDTSNRALNREDENIVDRLFPNVRLSSFTASQVRDTRDDPVDPARGSLLTIESEAAARTFGSEVGFSKSFLSGSVYRRMPGVPRIVMAAGARLGVAWGFPRTLETVAGRGEGRTAAPGTLALPISERFFGGGNTTVRGFALDRLGSPRTETGGTIDQDGFPQGGNAMVVFNGELRVRVTPALGVVAFLDAGNVYDRVEHLSLGRIRSGAGFGVRYNSPVGPLGFDVGFKLGERHFFGDETSPQQERLVALHFSFGQAF